MFWTCLRIKDKFSWKYDRRVRYRATWYGKVFESDELQPYGSTIYVLGNGGRWEPEKTRVVAWGIEQNKE